MIRTRMRTRGFISAVTLSVALALTACAPKDADVKAAVDTAITGVSGVSVAVTNGVATISGEFADEATRASTTAKVAAVKGVKSVADSSTIAPPPVVISPDDALRTSVATALAAFPTLTATISDGVITLNGEIKKADLPMAMQALSALNPKKIDNKATVKK
ncbi:BON domain-containing protein [Gemmatimonas groenlandica]|uniref:BON domain-containing protein n=1 Tax=Gemmatimonas groenlandica TaxID=2732249 RepID=A0A6M4IXX0_9BACT|nr:BON domain-containing protein [Gemmatimonas groenlandica]QJR37071.1 BON domain-containing protein [Gemmatimonas groenlandica]